MSTKAGGTDNLFLFTYVNHLLWDMVFILIFSIYLFIYSAMSTKTFGMDHLFLFTYGNFLLIYCGFRFNIQYLFIYLFKAMWTKTSRSNHLFLFTYANGLLIACGFSFNIYYIIQLFIYSKQCQQKQVEATFITTSNEVGARLYFNMCLWICPELVAAETRTVGKRVVRILLECFLVYLPKLVVVIYF